MFRLIGVAARLLGVFARAPTHAQTGPLIIDRSRPDRAPAATGAPQGPVVAGSVRADAQAFQPFVFQRLDVQGSTLPAADLQAAAGPFVGRTLTRADLDKLAAAVAPALPT